MTTSDGPRPIGAALPAVGDGTGLAAERPLHPEELGLALRNHALPLEALRYDVTPTGLHYTLVHYDIPAVDPATWRLDVDGPRPLALAPADLQRRPARTLRVTLECAGDGRALLEPRPISQPWLTGAVGTAEWTGTPLMGLLAEAGITAATSDVAEIVFTGLDRGIEGGVEQDYQRSLPLEAARDPDVLVAWAMNGAPLEPQHGAPVRLVVPGWYGMAHVKWLHNITPTAVPFAGYQQAIAYRYGQTRAEPGTPVTRMRVRSLLIPPGIPDFLTRTRVVPRGPVTLEGRAWSGTGPISAVEVSTDNGAHWAPAALAPPVDPRGAAWQHWTYQWHATTPGTYSLCCRAHDAGGAVQPTEPFWTARGMGNNEVQRVPVVVV